MSSDDGGIVDEQQVHDIALTVLAILGACLVAILLLTLFAPPEIGQLFEPVTRVFGEVVLGVFVWQIATVALLALGTWFLIIDIRGEKQ